MTGKLAGKIAVVTGSGGPGMGRAVALKFASEGARVIGCDIDAEGAEETVHIVEQAGGTMTSLHPHDLQQEGAVEALMATADREFGGIDILYNNAMWARFDYPLGQSLDDFEYTLQGTLLLPWRAVQHAVPYMRRGGSIINVASICGMPGGTGGLGNVNIFFPYGVGKAGVIRMTELLAIELAARDIRVNVISPGATLPSAEPLIGKPGSPTYQAWVDSLLIKRPGQAEDIAKAALFLASDDASYITGHNLPVDGGWSVSGGKGSPSREGFDLLNAQTGALKPPS
jgi:meso-butanediol dehydrogenase / (S,S)-butanediol dehydrogenase / diacetyl reductase